MAVPDFLEFVESIATATGTKTGHDQYTVLGALAAEDELGFLSMCLTLWGVKHRARVFTFFFASIPDSRIPTVRRAFAKHGLSCTWKRQTFGTKQVAFFVYAPRSALGKRVADALASTPDGTTAPFTGKPMDAMIGKALGYPTPTEPSKPWRGHSVGAVMAWSIPGTKLTGKVYSFSLLRDAPDEIRKAERLWTTAMRRIHKDIECKIHVLRT